MRHNVYVKIPINDEVAYSLYAQGLLSEIPANINDEYYLLKFSGGTAFILFYTFANFRRAYIVTEWESNLDGEKIFLPGIEAPLYVIYMAKGKKIDHLKHALHLLTKNDEYAPFKLSLDFWKKLSYQIEFYGSDKVNIFYIYNLYLRNLKNESN